MPCIYYGNRKNLTYKKREHVFPASLGCTTTLPQGWVSDQANEFFSRMEDDLIHRSVISMDRNFFGPGQRGSLSKKKAAQSDVSVAQDEKGNKVLSYMSLGEPYIVDCFCRTPERYHVQCISHESAEKFIAELKNFNEYTRFVEISSVLLSDEEVLVGFHNSKYYIAHSPDSKNKFDIQGEIYGFLKHIAGLDFSKANVIQSTVKMEFQMKETPANARMFAKIMLNTAAYLYGQEFVMRPEFDLVREWILEGKHSDIFFRLPDLDKNTTMKKIAPPDAHWCEFGMVGHKFAGVVCFYGSWERILPLAEFDRTPINRTDGFICDWKNKKDYKLIDYLSVYFKSVEQNERNHT